MSEVRDYGLDGANPTQLNTTPLPMRPPNIDLEAQSPRSPVRYQEKENKHPISPIVSYIPRAFSFKLLLRVELQEE